MNADGRRDKRQMFGFKGFPNRLFISSICVNPVHLRFKKIQMRGGVLIHSAEEETTGMSSVLT
jgi:hypothetical protein